LGGQSYLLPAFFEDDKAAIDALLFFERLSHKTQILLTSIDQTHGLADGTLPDTIQDTLVSVCEARFKLARFMVLCKRFTVNLQRCDPKVFVKMGKVFVELLALEKRLDSFIELAKKEELREAECGAEVDRYGTYFHLQLARLSSVALYQIHGSSCACS
jgi:dynactin 1